MVILKIPAKYKNIIFGAIMAIVVMFQAWLLYKTSIAPKKRNFIIVTKSPLRVITRWDQPDYYNARPGTMTQNILKILDAVEKEPFIPYVFNDSISVNLNILDVKSDEAKVQLDEKSTYDVLGPSIKKAIAASTKK